MSNDNENRHELTEGDLARSFIMGGKATVTMVSKRTGVRFTYKVSESKDGRVHFVALLRGPNNCTDYNYMGIIRNGRYFHGKKSSITVEAPSAKAFAWSWHFISQGMIPEGLEVWHEGQCCRCGRKLTVPESILTGIGPICAAKAA